jgi:threonine dehydratase
LHNAKSLADGLLPLSIGTLTFSIIQPVVADVALVDDEQLAGAVRALHGTGLRVEPSGAATTAALLAGAVDVDGPVVAIVSGGNVDDAVFHQLVG